MPVTRSLARSFETRGWIGTQTDLLNLVTELEAIGEERLTRVRQKHDSEEVEERAAYEEKWSSIYEDQTASMWADQWATVWEHRTKRMHWTASAKFSHLNETREGPARELIEQLTEPERVESLKLQFGSKMDYSYGQEDFLSIHFSRYTRPTIELVTGDLAWLDATEKQLQRVLERREPDYKKWLLTAKASGALDGAAFVLGGLFFFVFMISLVYISTEPGTWLNALVAIAVVSLPYTVVSSYRRMHKRLPRFEVIEPHSRPQGRAIVNWVRNAVLWILGTIAIPVVLGWLQAGSA